MEKYDNILLGLYFITLVIVVLGLSSIWPLAISLLLILIITLVNKMNTEHFVYEQKKERTMKINRIVETVTLMSKKMEDVAYNLDRHMFTLENRIDETKKSNEIGAERQYRELARKILEIENKTNSARKTLAAVFGNLDDRLQKIEDKFE
jgi:predicted  nucleic acid-binding Zn-ribbon protein